MKWSDQKLLSVIFSVHRGKLRYEQGCYESTCIQIKAAQIITDLRQNSTIKTISLSGQG